jgi:hypothetical protein
MQRGTSFLLLLLVLIDGFVWGFRYPVHALNAMIFSGLSTRWFYSGYMHLSFSVLGVAFYQLFEQQLLPRLWRFRLLFRVIRFVLVVLHFGFGFFAVYGLWFLTLETPELTEFARLTASFCGGWFVLKLLRKRLNQHAL